MIVVKEFPDKEFAYKAELFKALKDNKKSLISLKKATDKKTDSFTFTIPSENIKEVQKSKGEEISPDVINVKVVINTTNFVDSHNDLHIDGIWNKSVSDHKEFLHLQEHNRSFKHIISDNAKGSIESMTWKNLGLPYNGKTEALIFNSTIEKKRNEFMFEQYKNAWVRNHSVGMRYVKIDLALNSETEWDKEEKALWDKYYSVIANKEVADERGYFWVVSEAKIIEGSAVVMGSNSATPTISIEGADIVTPKTEPLKDTQTKQMPQRHTFFN